MTKSVNVEQSVAPCIVCAGIQQEGIRIRGQFICKQCEGEIRSTDVQDQKYSFFVKKLKQIWH